MGDTTNRERARELILAGSQDPDGAEDLLAAALDAAEARERRRTVKACQDHLRTHAQRCRDGNALSAEDVAIALESMAVAFNALIMEDGGGQ